MFSEKDIFFRKKVFQFVGLLEFVIGLFFLSDTFPSIMLASVRGEAMCHGPSGEKFLKICRKYGKKSQLPPPSSFGLSRKISTYVDSYAVKIWPGSKRQIFWKLSIMLRMV